MDGDLRGLERAARRGDAGARLALLVARRRAGRLDEERLACAARLGDPDARALLASAAPDVVVDALEWFETLPAGWGLEAAQRAAVAGARAALESFEREYPDDRGPRGCVEAAEAVLGCPCAEHATAARRRGDGQHRANVDRGRRARPRWTKATIAERAALYAARACSDVGDPGRARVTARLALLEAGAAAGQQVRRALVREVGGWLLDASAPGPARSKRRGGP